MQVVVTVEKKLSCVAKMHNARCKTVCAKMISIARPTELITLGLASARV